MKEAINMAIKRCFWYEVVKEEYSEIVLETEDKAKALQEAKKYKDMGIDCNVYENMYSRLVTR